MRRWVSTTAAGAVLLAPMAVLAPSAALPAAPVPECATGVLDIEAGRLGDVVDELSSAEAKVVAGQADMTLAQLQEHAADETTHVDECGMTFAVDPAVDVSDPGHAGHEHPRSSAAALASPAELPLADTFRLHSRPGARKTIYLDFLGETVTGTAWNQQAVLGRSSTDQGPIVVTPYSMDADPTVLSDAERASIQDLWSRVAEDFAPFDVDITTEQPPRDALERTDRADDRYGLTVLVGGGGAAQRACECGGVAWVNSFDSIGSSYSLYEYAFAFTEGATTSGEYLAGTISHESGHTLSLSHDGMGTQPYYRGSAPWSPIMGAGVGPVSQWSKGEYAGATNTEDDLAAIAQRLPYVADDHAGSTADATLLTDLSGEAPVEGLITTETDVDAFQFVSSGGQTSIEVTPRLLAGGSPNLDVRLDVLDAEGRLVESVRPVAARSTTQGVTGLDARWSGTLPEGSHYALVSGDSNGNPVDSGKWSKYGSLGRYTIAVTSGAGADGSLTVGSPAPVYARVGDSFSRTLAAVGGQERSWTKVSGPSWLTVSTEGLVRGTPQEAGTFSYTARVSAGAESRTVEGRVVVYAERYLDLTDLALEAVVGRTARATLTASPAAGEVVEFALVGGPTWATISRTGQLRLAPTALGTFGLTVEVTARRVDDAPPLYTERATVRVTVAPELVVEPMSLRAEQGKAFSAAVEADGGTGTYSYSLEGAPAGVSVDAAGSLSGTVRTPGTFSFVLVVRSGAQTSRSAVSLTVAAPPVARSTAPALSVRATAGRSVRANLAPRTGMTWRVARGPLPRGLSLSAAGLLSGTPKKEQTATITVVGTASGVEVTRTVRLQVAAPVKLRASASSVKVRKGRKVRVSLVASKGTPSYRFTRSTLPKGVKVSRAAGGRKLVLSGRPRTRGTFRIAVRVTDAHGSTSRVVLKLRVR